MSTNITNFNTWTEGNTDTLQFQTAYPKTLRQYKFIKKRNIFYPPALRNSGIKVKGKAMKSLVIPIVQSQLLLTDKLQFNVETPYNTYTYVTCTTNYSA
jgi:hypothetical protein